MGGYTASASVRAAAIAFLTLQNAAQALLVRLSRELRPAGAPPYLGSSVVLASELVKLGAALALMRRAGPGAHPPASLHTALLFAPPAAVYTLQNTLLLVAARVLDPPTFLVLSQAKILTTAGFSVVLLGRRLHRVRWVALTLLVVGVALVQHAHGPGQHGPAGEGGGDAAAPAAVTPAEYTAGVLSVALLTCCSGFAAVYTEACLKRLRVETQECNALMAAWGALFAAAALAASDGRALLGGGGGLAGPGGLFRGWSPVVAAVVAVSAAGGLLVAFFLRYLDAILKNFSATAAVVLSSAASVPLFGFRPSLEWALGAAVVASAMLLYAEHDVVDPPPRPHPALLRWVGGRGGAMLVGGGGGCGGGDLLGGCGGGGGADDDGGGGGASSPRPDVGPAAGGGGGGGGGAAVRRGAGQRAGDDPGGGV